MDITAVTKVILTLQGLILKKANKKDYDTRHN